MRNGFKMMLASALAFMPVASVFAEEAVMLDAESPVESVIDFDKTGSLTISYVDDVSGKEVEGAEFTLYKIGDITSNGGIESLLEVDVTPESDPAEIEAYVSDELFTYKGSTNDRGSLVFDELELGVYLAVETKPAKQYNKSASFMFEVPYTEEGGSWNYNVVAIPKADPIPEEHEETGLDGYKGIEVVAIGVCLLALGGVLYIYGKGQKKEEN